MDLADTGGTVNEQVEMVVRSGGVEVVLQHDDVRVVEDLLGLLSLEGMRGSKGERKPVPWDIVATTEAMRNERNKENIVSVEEGSEPSRGLSA